MRVPNMKPLSEQIERSRSLETSAPSTLTDIDGLTVTVWQDGHKFRLKFYNSDGLPWLEVDEVVTTIKKPHWWSKEKVPVEKYRHVTHGWTDKDRVKTAMAEIEGYLARLKMPAQEAQSLTDIINTSGGELK